MCSKNAPWPDKKKLFHKETSIRSQCWKLRLYVYAIAANIRLVQLTRVMKYYTTEAYTTVNAFQFC